MSAATDEVFINQKLEAPDRSRYSFRDYFREFMNEQFGAKGLQLAEDLLGESEEEKYMKYLERTFGVGAKLPEDAPLRRPASDFLAIGKGGGISDLGLVDTTLMTLSGAGVPTVSTGAALTESGILAGDALGEYRKGNTLPAAIMGGLASLPIGLRLLNPPPSSSKTTLASDQVDEGRRDTIKAIGTGALVGATMASPFGRLLSRSSTRFGTRVTPKLGKLLSGGQGEGPLDINSLALDKIKAKTYRDLGKNVEPDEMFGAEYEMADLIRSLDEENVLSKSPEKIKEYVLKFAKEGAEDYQYLGPAVQKEYIDIFSSDEYIKNVIKELENVKKIIRKNPTLREALEEHQKVDDMIMSKPGGYQFNYPGAQKDKELMFLTNAKLNQELANVGLADDALSEGLGQGYKGDKKYYERLLSAD
tara:strand:- start:5080 stop:6336 length:1257 start_codon:yes stop_codon:yes gene_type:complete